MKTNRPSNVSHTVRTRDAALRRLGRTNRWLIAGSAALTGVLTDVAANAFPGHSVRKASSTKRGSHTKHKPLAAPAQAPKPATTAPEQTPQPAEAAPAETAPAESQPPAESAPQARSEPAPAEETPPAAPEPAPRAEEPSEPVVSGGS
jgi:hypothetical protein